MLKYSSSDTPFMFDNCTFSHHCKRKNKITMSVYIWFVSTACKHVHTYCKNVYDYISFFSFDVSTSYCTIITGSDAVLDPAGLLSLSNISSISTTFCQSSDNSSLLLLNRILIIGLLSLHIHSLLLSFQHPRSLSVQLMCVP